jgi:tRNA(fMet)-specific endonuclease VapC
MIFIDTSAVIQLLRGDSPPVAVASSTLAISTIVELELNIGILDGGGARELTRVKSFLSEVEIFDFDSKAAMETSKIVAELWQNGKPIGDLDSQIAGHSLSLNLPLLTANTKHFSRIEYLELIDWNS